jgi:hypothetical protein
MDGFDVTQLFSVEGLVAVVTGGATGIGLCIFPFPPERTQLSF